jgi:peroxiredoxin
MMLSLTVAFAVWSLAMAEDGGDPRQAVIGQAAPDFLLKDLSGKEHRLSDYKGKIVVLEWTNHQCPFVMRHQGTLKTMQSTYAKHKDKGVVWLAVNSSHFCEKEAGNIRKWAKEQGIDFPILLDASGEVGRRYGAKTTPDMFVIDRQGLLAYSGAIDDDPRGRKNSRRNYVDETLGALLNGSTVAMARTQPYGCSVKYKK